MYLVSLHGLKSISRLWSNGSNYLRSAYSAGYVYFCFSQGKLLQVLASLQGSVLLGEPKKTSTFAIWQTGPKYLTWMFDFKYLTWMFDLMIWRVVRAGQHSPLSPGVAVDCKLLSNSLLWRDPALSYSDYDPKSQMQSCPPIILSFCSVIWATLATAWKARVTKYLWDFPVCRFQ